jgi:Protein of unknown function (DUF3168)
VFAQELFAIANVAPVQAVLGAPARVYPHADAPPNPGLPYAVFSTISGTPGNTLSDTPTHDDERVQWTIWGDTVASVQPAALALRDVLEPLGHVVGYGELGRDPETKRFGIYIDWLRFRSR